MSPRLHVWCLVEGQKDHVTPVEEHLGDRAVFTYDDEWDPDRLVSASPDIIVCVNDWPYGIVRCIDAARRSAIPSVVLQDGILEWRCQYENPLFGAAGGAPQHQPVMADHIACIGAHSGRQIEAWGNPGKAVVTGMPRLDHLLERRMGPAERPGRRLLVMTAKTPGFTREQVDTTLRSLQDLKRYLDTRPDLQVIWRVSRSLVDALGVQNTFATTASTELASLLGQVDAVITTPSTAMLEAMVLDRPVAALDYHNVPHFVPAAWTISAREHIAPTVRELILPPPSKMLFQRHCLVDELEMCGPAAPRVAALLLRLAARADAGAMRMQGGLGPATPGLPELSALYPDAAVFSEHSPESLMVRLARAEKEIELSRRRAKVTTLTQRASRLGRTVLKSIRATRPRQER